MKIKLNIMTIEVIRWLNVQSTRLIIRQSWVRDVLLPDFGFKSAVYEVFSSKNLNLMNGVKKK